jgi:hypothetical protein
LEEESVIPIHRPARSGAEGRSADLPKGMPITPREAPKGDRRPSRLKWLLVFFIIIVVIGAIAYIASTYYAQASFTIIPKTISIPIDGTYVADPSAGSGNLTYELVTLQGAASSTVPAADGPETSAKAQGKVTVYNSWSKDPQRLIAGTRLANDRGLIYRLTSSVVIPGLTKPGATVIPGSVSATIVAGAAGETYNISRADPQSDFKMVAYRGTAKYGAIYARLSSDVNGGFTGTRKVVSDAVMASTTASLQSAMTASLLPQAKNAIPEGYMMFDKGYTAFFSEPAIGGSQSKTAIVTVRGTIYGFLFKKSSLVDAFSEGKAGTTFGNSGYRSSGLEDLQFAITNVRDFSPGKKIPLVIRASGNLKLSGLVPIDEVRKKLAGLPLGGTADVFKSYAVIESGSGELMPPWAKIPADLKRIKITVEGQQ